MARTLRKSPSDKQTSTAFGQLVRTLADAQLRALMRAVFYRERRYQSFCAAPLAISGPDAYAGSAMRHAIRSGRLVRSVAGSFTPLSRDLMLAAALLIGAGAIEAFNMSTPARPRLSARGRIYPVATLSALLVHDAQVTIDRHKREALEGLILQSAWLAGMAGTPEYQVDDFGWSLSHEARVLALCLQLDRFAAHEHSAQTHQVDSAVVRDAQASSTLRWSVRAADDDHTSRSSTRASNQSVERHLTLVTAARKDDDEHKTQSRFAAG
jgi:hypothetical protein